MKTDNQIKQDVELELESAPAVNAAGIFVKVRDWIVTLAGHLGSYSEKLAAEKAAQRVQGVSAAVVELDVRIWTRTSRTRTSRRQRARCSTGPQVLVRTPSKCVRRRG